MSFDWFTLAAQLVNFALLLVLLRVFLYRPVMDLMERRQEQLTRAWSDAHAAEAAAREESARLTAARAELVNQRDQRLVEVEAEVAALRERLLGEARRAAQDERDRQATTLAREREALVNRLLEEGARTFIAELNDSLAELADAGLEEQAARLFVSRLRDLPEHDRQRLRATDAQPVVTTAFPPSPEVRQLLGDAAARLTGADREPRFEQDGSLLFGAALEAGPVRVEASGRRRLRALRSAFRSALDRSLTTAPAEAETDDEGADEAE